MKSTRMKVLAVLLCFALCLNWSVPAFATENAGETKSAESTQTTESGSSETSTEPSQVDLGGFTLRIRSESFHNTCNSTNPDKYDAVVQERIDAVAKEYNFRISTLPVYGNINDYNTVVNAMLSGSTNVGHFIETTVSVGLVGAAAGYFQDLNTIDKSTGFDAADSTRFWQDVTKTATFEGKQFGVAFISGSRTFTTPSDGVFWMFNVNAVQNGGYSAETIYKLVRDYQWTLDEATKIIEACHVPDSNGDGVPEVYGLGSYKTNVKYFLQLDGGQTVRKVNGKYTSTLEDANIMSVLNWIRDVYATKKIAIVTGASTLRHGIRNGDFAFIQCAPDYLYRTEFMGTYEDDFAANVRIIPSPVGSNQIAKKTYINPTTGTSSVYVMPVTVIGETKTKAATAFAAIAKAVNNKADRINMMIEEKRLNDANMIVMYENYILGNAAGDLGYITGVPGSSSDPISNIVLSVTNEKGLAEAIVANSADINSLINTYFENVSTPEVPEAPDNWSDEWVTMKKLPEVMEDGTVDLGGFTLRIRSGSFYGFMNATTGLNKYDEEIRDRINEVSQKYNFELVTTAGNVDYSDYNTVLSEIRSGSKTIGHFVETTVPLGLAGVVGGYFQDLNTFDKSTGFDVTDETRFWQGMTNAAVFEGKQYGVALITKSQNFTTVSNGVFWFFNKNVLQKGGYSANAIYKLVREYKWTLEEATKIMEACYVPDANGDGQPEVYGLLSYKRQNKYYIQLDGGQTASKVNGNYVFTATNDNVMSVLNWLKDVYVTKKLAITTGSGNVRTSVRDGKTVFAQAGPDYLTRAEFTGSNAEAYIANVGIVPSPVGSNQIKKKTYINPASNARIYVMPVTIKGNEKTWAATAFAAIAKAINSEDEQVDMLVETNRLNDADMIDMYENYIINNFVSDPGYVSESVGNSDSDTVSAMVLEVCSGTSEPQAAVEKYSGTMQSLLDIVYRNGSTIPSPTPTPAPITNLDGFTLRIRSSTLMAFLGNTNPDKYDKEIQDRINEVAKEYNFKIATTACINEGGYQDYVEIQKAVQSGSDSIGHFILTSIPLGLAGISQGVFQDLNTIDKSTGFDTTDSTRFWQDMTNAAVFEGKQYGVALITQSNSLTTVSNGVFWFFNKNVLQKGGYSANAIYKLVREYKWTLDEATKIMEACYVPDANGDGVPEVYGLMSYKRQNKYYIQLDGGQTVSKVNGKYIFTATNDNVMSVLNWLKDVYVTKKLAITTGSSTLRTSVRDGQTVFAQGAPDYLTRSEFAGSNAEAYIANIGIIPSPVGNNQIAKKTYINPTANARIYSMPSTVTGDTKTKAATAFAAIAKAINNKEEQVNMLVETKRLNDADMIDMYENYITKNFVADPGYITEIFSVSDRDLMAQMVLSVSSGSKDPSDAIAAYRQDIEGIASWHFNEESGTWANGFCGAEGDGANVTWEMDYSGKLTISGSGDMANYSMESVSTLPPWVIYGPWIRSVVIKEGVTSIGNYAFYEMNMAVYPSVNGNAATSGATYEALTSIEIRKSVTSIGNYAFGNSSTLETVYYAGFAEEWNAIEIGSNNQSLINANIIMLNGVIASGTCGAAGNETNVVWELADGVLTISGNGAMADFMWDDQPWYNYIDEIYAIVIADGVTNVGNYAFFYSTALTNVTISKSVKIVGSHAFANCTALTDVTIPSSVTSIGFNAFLNCDSLMTITIPANVTSIDCGAFGGIECEFVVETGNAYYHVSGNCLIETATNTLISGNSTSVIPNYVTSIGNRAFINCHAIKAISIPVGVTSIEDEAFHCCGSLVNVIIPEGVTSIGNQAFMYCGALTSINIPSSVTSIGALAFDGCENLKSINLPEGLTIIGYGAFAYCSSLTNITIPTGVISIDGSFSNCSALASITIPKSVTSIRDYAFYNCSALETVYYTGTEAEWNAITIGTNNDSLLNATIHYNYVAEEEIPEEPVGNIGSINAVITAPEGGWKVGENTFKVEAEKACYVAVSYDGGQTYVRVPAIQDANGGYRFTAEDMDANTIVSVGHVGDVDGDGIVRARDARLALQAASGMTELGGLGQLSADLDGDGNIRAREARLMLQAASDMHTLDW